MADMYGVVRSNVFKVKDASAFRHWFAGNVEFGYDIEIWGNENGVAFGGHEQYPTAFPFKKQLDDDIDRVEWDLELFAKEIRLHLQDGEEFRVLAVGFEKLRNVSATHLRVTKDSVTFTDLFEGN